MSATNVCCAAPSHGLSRRVLSLLSRSLVLSPPAALPIFSESSFQPHILSHRSLRLVPGPKPPSRRPLRLLPSRVICARCVSSQAPLAFVLRVISSLRRPRTLTGRLVQMSPSKQKPRRRGRDSESQVVTVSRASEKERGESGEKEQKDAKSEGSSRPARKGLGRRDLSDSNENQNLNYPCYHPEVAEGLRKNTEEDARRMGRMGRERQCVARGLRESRCVGERRRRKMPGGGGSGREKGRAGSPFAYAYLITIARR
eukprot:237587-Rhodomonas_salina.2